jgi:hypothetical protein
MNNIIFSKLYEKTNDVFNNINNSLNNYNNFKTDIIDIIFEIPNYYMVIFIFISFIIYFIFSKLIIRLNDILIFLIIIVFFYVMLKVNSKTFYNFIKDKDEKLNFLHKMMFNTNNWTNNNTNNNLIVRPEGYFKKSYLYLNQSIIDLYYSVRNYSQFNIDSYVKSLIHTNNLLKLSYESKQTKINSYNYTIAVDEMNNALNEFASIIYSLPLSEISYKNEHNSILILRSLLTAELEDMNIIYKNNNKTEDITIDSYPDDFYDVNFILSSDDTKDINYSNHYNLY